MCDAWMPLICLPLTPEQFRQLPRNPAFKYEYLGGQAYLTPRPKHYHAVLPLRPLDGVEAVPLRPLGPGDFDGLVEPFTWAFEDTQPFGSLDEPTLHEAARSALERTRTGGDGPWVEGASFVALDEGKAVGAVLVTLLPPGDPRAIEPIHWAEPPPADCVARRLGRPHLTWIFVTPFQARQGVGRALLAAAAGALLGLGYTHLLSTFLLGNEASALWHWRNGFELLSYPYAFRPARRRGGQKGAH
jgi:GNAT superfamily N-acetyltransferase